MRIGLDATYSLGRNLSGVGAYSREILGGLPVAHAGPEYLFCYRSHRFLRSYRETLPPGAQRRLLWRDWPRHLDLFHSLNQRVDNTRARRIVSTFHDLFVLTGEYSTAEFRERFAAQARRAAERSDLIIAVSAFTARQVEELLHVDAKRIRVVYHGVSIGATSGQGERTPTILFVGAIQKRKNVIRLVQAFERTLPGWRLQLAGSPGYEAALVDAAVQNSPRRADIELLGYVSGERLEELYRSASIFAFPSLDEGFGMPVLEAMARGLPVLVSNGSALAEIAGDAALRVDALDVDSIAHGLQKLTANPQTRAALAQRGFARSREFSWERAVKETWAVYNELL